MNPKQFLTIGGIVLVLVAVLGFLGIIGPTANQSIFGPNWWFDNYENWAHLVLGVVALIASFVLNSMLQKYLTIIVGIVGIFFAIYSGFVSTDFLGAGLENPADTVLHLVVGVWALWAGMRKSSMMM